MDFGNIFDMEMTANPLRLSSGRPINCAADAKFRGSFLFHVSKIAMTDYLCRAKYPNKGAIKGSKWQ
jgi:hypothetical protein